MKITSLLIFFSIVGILIYIRSKCKTCNKFTKDNPKNVIHTNTAIGFEHLNEDVLKTQKDELTQILNSNYKKAIFTCKWFDLVKDGHYYYIDYGRESSGIVILPIVDNTHIIFVKNHRYPIKQDSWELPRGFIDNNESFIEAGLRELIEETGYKGNADQCTVLGLIAPDTSIINNKVPVIQANLSTIDKTDLELDKEISQIELVPLSQLNDWMKNHNVIDGVTLSALYKYTNK